MARAKYHYNIEDYNGREVLVVYDDFDASDPSTTVTNDMEAVLTEIKEKENGILPSTIIYQDTEGIFDGVRFSNGIASFYNLGDGDLEDALPAALKYS